MATSTTHQPFPSRPYAPGLGRTGGQNTFGGTPYAGQTPFAAPQPQNPGYGPSGTASGAAVTTQQQREAQRLERERQERLERERREAEERSALEQISDEQKEEINEAFGLFDLDKDHHIDYHELRVALKALGFDLPKSDILAILQTHGIPASSLNQSNARQQPLAHPDARPAFTGPARLLLPEAAFQLIAAQRMVSRDPQEEILRAFELFDTDNKGRIEVGDLRRVARELGEGLQEEELRAMIEEFDVRGEGGIDREAFLGICLQ
ncbi:Calcium-binding component of the spindle pole body (SPB) half-bridge [Elasticomyces elasticus]|nr:Calcium-binding component of the spindle pole body (SPB) half-bridge [Elasticomyces elasticus]KAK4958919.1 Calcium-binding component of the spindle pole body (SPB) half-bridge [Elasticomyces elasticus]KAK4978092.1 Calcium-binding component of the spindle pole body (SPB) half-bridge [Elasticomyces elasticus]KAK5745495.1 Calcium-binding component of the spindle pole body (SPB) half-bridge [Elasticomyces elasticus]